MHIAIILMILIVILVNSLNFGVFMKQDAISMLIRWKPNIVATDVIESSDNSLFTLSRQNFDSYIQSRILLEAKDSFAIVCLSDDDLICMFACQKGNNLDIIKTCLWHPDIVNKDEIILSMQHKYFSEYDKNLVMNV